MLRKKHIDIKALLHFTRQSFQPYHDTSLGQSNGVLTSRAHGLKYVN